MKSKKKDRPTLKDWLVKYFKESEGQWIKKANLFGLAYEYGYSPETLGRELRNLSETKPYMPPPILAVDYYDGEYAKGLAQYSYNPLPKLNRQKVEIINGVAKITYI